MPAIIITGNPHLTSFDFKTVFDLAIGQIRLDLSPTVWTGGGEALVSNARVKLTSPSGQILKDGTVNDFLPPMNQTLGVVIPKVAGTYEWGYYTFEVTLNDGASSYFSRKVFNLCPVSEDIKSNFGRAVFTLTPDCKTGIMLVHGGDGYAYQNVKADSWIRNITFYFPQESDQPQISSIVNTPFEVELYTGESLVKGASVGTYTFPDQFIVLVRYIGEARRMVRCMINYCHVYCALESLLYTIEATDINSVEFFNLKNKYDQAIRYLALIDLGHGCGKEIDVWVDKLEKLIGIENCCRECGKEEVGIKVGEFEGQPLTSSTTTGPATTSTTAAPTTSTTSTTEPPSSSTTAPPGTTSTTAPPGTTSTTAPPGTTSTTTGNPCPDCTDINGSVSDDNTSTTTSTTTSEGGGGPITSTTTTGQDNIYSGSKASGEMPDAGEIIVGNWSLQNGANDVNANYVPAGANFHWIAIPDLGGTYVKNTWFVDVFNTGDMGTESDLFGPSAVVNVGGTNYRVWITNFATAFSGITIFKN